MWIILMISLIHGHFVQMGMCLHFLFQMRMIQLKKNFQQSQVLYRIVFGKCQNCFRTHQVSMMSRKPIWKKPPVNGKNHICLLRWLIIISGNGTSCIIVTLIQIKSIRLPVAKPVYERHIMKLINTLQVRLNIIRN